MKKSVIIVLVFLLILPISYALFDFFNYKLIQDKLEIELNKDILSNNELLSIEINPTYKGFYYVIYILDNNRNIVDSIKLNCEKGICYNKEIINYYIPPNFNGIYTINVFDYSSLSYETSSFNVIPKTSFQASAFEAEANNWDIGAYEFQSWQPPIGIPDPADYWNGLDPIDDSAPNPTTHCPKWPSATNSKADGDSYDCYYVDKTHPSATNTNNPYGYPDKPRLTPPEGSLSAGAYVYIHAGTYTGSDSGGDRFDWYGSGTPTEPIWITGNSITKPVFQDKIHIGSGGNANYVILENIGFEATSSATNIQVAPSTDGHLVDHVVLRNIAMIGTGTDNDPESAIIISISQGSDTLPNSMVDYTVVYNVNIHDWGDNTNSGGGGDECGVYMGYHTDYLWVLDSTIYNMGADSVCGSHYADYTSKTASHYFIGRNNLYGNDENGIDLKAIRYAIISENTIYGPWSGPPYEAIILHYGTASVGVRDSWVMFNTIYNSGNGIVTTSGENIDIVGNVIYNIHHIDAGYNPASAYSQGAAIHYRNFNGMARIVDNTIYDYDTGVQIPAGVLGPGDSLQIHGNIFSNRAEPNAYEIYIAGGTDYVDINYNQVYYPGGSAVYGWGSSTQRSLTWMISNTDECDNENEGNPQFVNPPTDLSLQSSSPAIDDSIEHPTVYDDFYAQYSISIEKDKDGITRPQGIAWDIGAYEYVSGEPTTTTTSTTTSTTSSTTSTSSTTTITTSSTTTTTTSTTTTSTTTTTIIFQIELQQGWNLIGIPYAEADPRVEAVFSEILNRLVTVYSYLSPKKWEVYHNSQSIPYHLFTVNDRQGYWVKVNETATLINEGIINNTKLNYNLGWNLIAVEKEESLQQHLNADNRIKEAYNYTKNNNSYTYLPKDVILHKGRGYWILVNETI